MKNHKYSFLYNLSLLIFSWFLTFNLLSPYVSSYSENASSVFGPPRHVRRFDDVRLRPEEFVHDSLKRSYTIARPDSLDMSKHHPVLMLFHGGDGNIKGIMESMGRDLLNLCMDNKVIFVLPEAVEVNWNDGRDTIDSRHDGRLIDDVGYVSALMKRLITYEGANPNRIFLAGVSDGGMMVQRLILEMPGRFASAVSMIGSLPERLFEQYNSDVPSAKHTDMLILLSTADPFVPWEGGAVELKSGRLRGKVISGQDTRDFWLRRFGIPLKADKKEMLPSYHPDGKVRAYREEYNNRFTRCRIEFYRIENAGHTLPVKKNNRFRPVMNALVDRVSGDTCYDLSSSRLIWNFFFPGIM